MTNVSLGYIKILQHLCLPYTNGHVRYFHHFTTMLVRKIAYSIFFKTAWPVETKL